MNRTSSFGLLALLVGCGTNSADVATFTSEIRFGEPVRVGDFPSVGFVAPFAGDRSAGVLCTGSLIAPDVVLTAAHCLEDAEAGNWDVFFARELIAFLQVGAQTPRWVKAVGWAIHPDYVSASDGRIAHDVAVVYLDSIVASVELPYLADERTTPRLQVGAPVAIVGFGEDETNSSGPLRKAKTIISFVDELELRTGGRAPEPSRCSGDSGALTFMDVDGKATQISVNSFGFASCDSASTEMRVDAYLSWIVGAMRSACDDGTRITAGCANTPDPNLAPPSAQPDAGVREPPSVGSAPDAGFVDLTARAAEGGCRCAGRTQDPTLLFVAIPIALLFVRGGNARSISKRRGGGRRWGCSLPCSLGRCRTSC